MNEFQFTTVTVSKLEWDKLLNTMDVLNEKVSKLVTKHDKELLTKKEVMQLLKIGRTTLDRYIDEGILTEVKLEKGKRGYIKYSQITDLMHKENKKR
ncbi:helix-turn-helix domain-containing protein [Chishuiella sp.]|uniref:helix-turn-helix transcriptional regulator n=1 Tax=Chishuiella sp. TaxID=1969467 RepID=UPI0028A7E58A|nr:helix-turn-helix domain-containing protein [Chishuiella sp.]